MYWLLYTKNIEQNIPVPIPVLGVSLYALVSNSFIKTLKIQKQLGDQAW